MSEAHERPKQRARNTRPSACLSVRIPWHLKRQLDAAAEAAGHTLTAEITDRLEQSFRPGEDAP